MGGGDPLLVVALMVGAKNIRVHLCYLWFQYLRFSVTGCLLDWRCDVGD
jgi:hypothetical protein